MTGTGFSSVADACEAGRCHSKLRGVAAPNIAFKALSTSCRGTSKSQVHRWISRASLLAVQRVSPLPRERRSRSLPTGRAPSQTPRVMATRLFAVKSTSFAISSAKLWVWHLMRNVLLVRFPRSLSCIFFPISYLNLPYAVFASSCVTFIYRVVEARQGEACFEGCQAPRESPFMA